MKHIELSQFEEHVTQMHQDRDKGFELEYQVTFPLPPSLTHSLSSPSLYLYYYRHSVQSQHQIVMLLRMLRTRIKTDLPTYFHVSTFH